MLLLLVLKDGQKMHHSENFWPVRTDFLISMNMGPDASSNLNPKPKHWFKVDSLLHTYPYTHAHLWSHSPRLSFSSVQALNPISAQSAQVLVFPSPYCTLHTDVKQEIKVMKAFKCNWSVSPFHPVMEADWGWGYQMIQEQIKQDRGVGHSLVGSD